MIDGMFMRFASTFKCTISGMRCLVWENGAAEKQKKKMKAKWTDSRHHCSNKILSEFRMRKMRKWESEN